MLGFYLALLDTAEEKSRFEELYIKYKQDMYSIAYSILHNAEDATALIFPQIMKTTAASML